MHPHGLEGVPHLLQIVAVIVYECSRVDDPADAAARFLRLETVCLGLYLSVFLWALTARLANAETDAGEVLSPALLSLTLASLFLQAGLAEPFAELLVTIVAGHLYAVEIARHVYRQRRDVSRPSWYRLRILLVTLALATMYAGALLLLSGVVDVYPRLGTDALLALTIGGSLGTAAVLTLTDLLYRTARRLVRTRVNPSSGWDMYPFDSLEPSEPSESRDGDRPYTTDDVLTDITERLNKESEI